MSANPKGVETARDHVEKARDILALIRNNAGSLNTDQLLKAAQIHATLAMAEAARTANMLTFASMEVTPFDEVIRRVDN